MTPSWRIGRPLEGAPGGAGQGTRAGETTGEIVSELEGFAGTLDQAGERG